jgi:DNA-binding IclR family transcriptional regulator
LRPTRGRDDTGQGRSFIALVATLSANIPIIPLAMPILHNIARQSDETTLLSLFYPKQLQKAFVAQVESSRSMRYVIELNTRGSMLWGASAHAILAFLNESTMRLAFSDRETSPSTGSKVNRNALRRELARIRTEGYARSVGARVETVVGIAVPIFGADGLVKGSLSITYPDSRMDETHNRTLIVLRRQRRCPEVRLTIRSRSAVDRSAQGAGILRLLRQLSHRREVRRHR